jgi:hypothetical protein
MQYYSYHTSGSFGYIDKKEIEMSYKIFDKNDSLLIDNSFAIDKDLIRVNKYHTTNNGNLLLELMYNIEGRNSGIGYKLCTANGVLPVQLDEKNKFSGETVFANGKNGITKVIYTYKNSKKDKWEGFSIANLNEDSFSFDKKTNIDVIMEPMFSSIVNVLEEVTIDDEGNTYVFLTACNLPKRSDKIRGSNIRGYLYKFNFNNELVETNRIDYDPSTEIGIGNSLDFLVSNNSFYYYSFSKNLVKYKLTGRNIEIDKGFKMRNVNTNKETFYSVLYKNKAYNFYFVVSNNGLLKVYDVE